ncbi:hypothetical protein [Actinoallomurus soli]|uniref:hypothetical protein n=1 Tax=Actinoallomurus soli TaxID=2952535 RepID=UPI0020929B6A|nr:hypothetical protein [Actinoallomurus soli]MCO5970015.1 hypothetical protein [Actinoallomurus soli]
MTAHVFVDESTRRDRYLLCAATVEAANLDEVRRLLRGLCLPGQRRWHFKHESRPRQRQILDAIVRSDAVRGLIYEGYGKELPVRRECLAALVFADRRARRLVIESRETMDHFDRSCIAQTLRKSSESLSYAHLRPHEEPALWLPDALAWTYGAGGDWRRRVQPIIELTRNVGVIA